MIYYEWIENLEKLKNGPRDEALLEKLCDSKIDLSGNINYRFINHINDVITTRLKENLEKILSKLKIVCSDINSLSLEIISIKNEFIYCKKIINLPVIPEENKNKFRETLQEFANDINQALENGVSKFDTTGEALMMIKNSKINILED